MVGVLPPMGPTALMVMGPNALKVVGPTTCGGWSYCPWWLVPLRMVLSPNDQSHSLWWPYPRGGWSHCTPVVAGSTVVGPTTYHGWWSVPTPTVVGSTAHGGPSHCPWWLVPLSTAVGPTAHSGRSHCLQYIQSYYIANAYKPLFCHHGSSQLW